MNISSVKLEDGNIRLFTSISSVDEFGNSYEQVQNDIIYSQEEAQGIIDALTKALAVTDGTDISSQLNVLKEKLGGSLGTKG